MRNSLEGMAAKHPRTLSTQELADTLEVGIRTVRRYTSKGCPTSRTARGNRYNLEEVREWLEAERLTGKPGRPVTEEGEKRRSSKARLEAARAAKAELEVSRMRRELLERDDVVGLFTAFNVGIRDTLTNLARGQEVDRREWAEAFAREALEQIHALAVRLEESRLEGDRQEEETLALEAAGEADQEEEPEAAGHA